MAELVEQVGQELGVTDTRIAVIFFMLHMGWINVYIFSIIHRCL